MAESYATATDNITGFTRVQLLEALATFLAYDPSWTVYKATISDPADTGYDGEPVVFGKTNGTAEEDFVIHVWQTKRRSGVNVNIGMNLSKGPYIPWINGDTGTQWWSHNGARYGETEGLDRKYCHCRTSHTTDKILQYHFFGFDDFVYVVFLTEDNIWRNFGFGHINKLTSFVGSAFCCASWVTEVYSDQEKGNDGQYAQFFDLHGNTSENTNDDYNCSQVRCDTVGGTLRYALGSYLHRWTVTTGDNHQEMFGADDVASFSGHAYSSRTNWYAGFEYRKMESAPSSFGLTSPLIPIYIYIEQPSSQMALIGNLPNIFQLNIKNLAETSEIPIQGNQYIVFPASRKTSSTDNNDSTPNSYYWGFCVRKPV